MSLKVIGNQPIEIEEALARIDQAAVASKNEERKKLKPTGQSYSR